MKELAIITTFLGPEPIKLPTNENKVQELTNKLLGTHRFPQCIETIDNTHIEIVELNEHYSDFLFFSNRSRCVRLKILLSKRSDKMTRKRA